MNRRDLLKQIALLTGGVVIGGEVFLSGCKTAAKSETGFTAENIALLNEVGETIIPATNTPGAKAAQVGEFMKTFVIDCYTEREQKAFIKGMDDLNETCKKMYNKSFMEADATQRHDLLVSLEKEAKPFNQAIDDKEKTLRDAARKEAKEFDNTPKHYYTMMKQMTLMGFFTSKTGATETLRHIQVPGKYDGALPYKKGDRAWAESL